MLHFFFSFLHGQVVSGTFSPPAVAAAAAAAAVGAAAAAAFQARVPSVG